MTYRPTRVERLLSAAARDGRHCDWCRRTCSGLVRPTTDHLVRPYLAAQLRRVARASSITTARLG